MTGLEVDPRRLAAVVFDDRVSIDSLLMAFAGRLSCSDTRIAGLIQLAAEESGCGPGVPMRLHDVATNEALPLCQTLPPGTEGCRLDAARLRAAAQRLRSACDTDAELIFVSRFGKLEAHGQGFREEMAAIVDSGHALLTAVRRGLVHNWYEFTGGIGTVLDARLWVLEDWWRDIAPKRRRAESISVS